MMSFKNIIGQKRVITILERAVRNKRLPHALLFHGPDGVGKVATAMELAKAVFCQQEDLYCDNCSDCKRVAQLSHPDLIMLFPAPKEPKIEELKTIRSSIADSPYFRTELWAKPEILIKTIRDLKKTVSMKSYENKGRVVILLDAHRFRTEAANSFLKLLEEPPEKLQIILVTSKPNMLLSTIISRCQQVKFDPLSRQDIELALIEKKQVNHERANIVSRMSFGSYFRALELLDEDIDQKQDLMIEILRKILKSDLDLLLLVESLTGQYDLKIIKDLIVMMSIWFRDAKIIETLQEQDDYKDKIINIDQFETLQKFVESFQSINYEKVLEKLESALYKIERNVFLNLVLFQLLFDMKKLLRRK
jgi:DNA polymerase III subunit delta'